MDIHSYVAALEAGNGRTALVGLSGGVDSAVAAWLLRAAGWRVTGVTMRIWDGSIPLADEGRSGCFGPGEARDVAAAADICGRLGIPHHAVDLADEYRAGVLDYFRAEYLAGKTPNPCVMCNRRVKFGALLGKARAMGLAFDAFATGHYARVVRDPDSRRWILRRGADADKDQSYFLSHLGQEQLRQLIFPLGELTKPMVRDIARANGLGDLAEKPESQDFIESKHYEPLFRPEDARPGPILTTAGQEIGRHLGIIHYTIGQRKGLGIGGQAEPLFVVRLDCSRNAVIVGRHEELFAGQLVAREINWIALAGLDGARRARVRIRQQHPPAPAELQPAGPDGVRVIFDEPQMSVTPGQIAVFYDEDRVLGGGTIA